MGKVSDKFNALKAERRAKSQLYTIEGETYEKAASPDSDEIVPEGDYPNAKKAVLIDGCPIRLADQTEEKAKKKYKVVGMKANAEFKDANGRLVVEKGQEKLFAF